MSKNNLYRAFNNIDDDILERSETVVIRRKMPFYLKKSVQAACLALIIGLTGVAFAAEAEEYSAATEFFAANGLSTEGLTRSDIKAIYRDITTKRFTYDKTAEVIQRSVQGTEIFQSEPTPEDLEKKWNANFSNQKVRYSVDIIEKSDENLGVVVFDKCLMHCYKDGALAWTTEISDFAVHEQAPVSEDLAVWGYKHTPTLNGSQNVYTWLAKMDNEGQIKWKHQLNHGFSYEYIEAVVDNGDNTFAVISNGDSKYLCLSQYDLNGNELSFYKTDMGNTLNNIYNTIRFEDGYLLQFGNMRLVKLSREGVIIDNFTYEGEDCDYHITDMTEFEGRIYLSAYAVPKQTENPWTRAEIDNILDYIFEKDDLYISPEELTPVVRENYTAVLLICDSDGGEPQAFYSVKGSLGGVLKADNGQLCWDVQSITGAAFSPYTGSFSLAGTCKVYRYTFDSQNTLVAQEDTGEIVPYSR